MVIFAAIQKRVWFWLSYPFEMLAFQWRKRRDWQRIVPPLWLSPGELMASDLEQYVSGEGKGKIDAAFIDGIVKTRDETLSLIKKQLIISFLIFLFLFGNFIDIGIDLNISGFSLKYGKGIPEGLMLLSNLLSAYTLMLQSNVYLMDSAIKFFVRAVLPAELRPLNLIRYYPHEHFGAYTPFNLPHILPSPLTSKLNKYTAVIFLLFLIPTFLVYLFCYALLVLDLWQVARLGLWTKLIAAYIALTFVYGLMFLLITRVRLRYLDYTVNHEIELLGQVAPDRVNARLQELYGRLNEDRANMIQRGLLKQP